MGILSVLLGVRALFLWVIVGLLSWFCKVFQGSTGFFSGVEGVIVRYGVPLHVFFTYKAA